MVTTPCEEESSDSCSTPFPKLGAVWYVEWTLGPLREYDGYSLFQGSEKEFERFLKEETYETFNKGWRKPSIKRKTDRPRLVKRLLKDAKRRDFTKDARNPFKS